MTDDLWTAQVLYDRGPDEFSATAISRGATARAARAALRGSRPSGSKTLRIETLSPFEDGSALTPQRLAWAMPTDVSTVWGDPARTALRDDDRPFDARSLPLGPPDDDGVPKDCAPLVTGPAMGAAGDAPPHGLFALLDAARIQGLPEWLEAAGLEAACLFDGKTAEEQADVAPWIVRLAPGDRLLRAYFDIDPSAATMAPAIASGPLWQHEPGLLIRSDATLSALRTHLRRFVTLPDPVTERRVFFRFWAPETLRTLIAHMAEEDRATLLRGIDAIMGPDGRGGLFALTRTGVFS